MSSSLKWESGTPSPQSSLPQICVFSWDGAAHVAIGIDIIGAGFITPAVKRLNFFANVRIALTRMVPRMPGFGAMLISFTKPPLVTFDLDCGPGIGELIEAWLIPFLKNDLLGNMLVWPNRIVIPLMPPDVLGPLDNLQLHTRGVLKVTVVEAKGLPKSDLIGKGDPFAILETVAFKPVKTKVPFPVFLNHLPCLGHPEHVCTSMERNDVFKSSRSGSVLEGDGPRSGECRRRGRHLAVI